MDIYISDIKGDRSHPMSVGKSELEDKLEELGIDRYYSLEEILIALCDRIKELEQE